LELEENAWSRSLSRAVTNRVEGHAPTRHLQEIDADGGADEACGAGKRDDGDVGASTAAYRGEIEIANRRVVSARYLHV
jgi:hypothetical protein